MQVMPATAAELGVRPRTKRLAGAPSSLSRPVIAAYHAGPRALGAKPWPPATRRYVRAVVECWRSF